MDAMPTPLVLDPGTDVADETETPSTLSGRTMSFFDDSAQVPRGARPYSASVKLTL